ncbi:MAG: S26 family signal peptidase, partial [Candidatus Hydrothermarchaeales archaeon]
LNIGDEVLVKQAEPVNIRRGDVIVFRNQDKLETHRVIRVFSKDTTAFLQKGDNVRIGGVVQESQLVGRVSAVKKGDRIIQFNSLTGKTINGCLTFFAVPIYYLAQRNSTAAKMVLSALNKMKKVFLYGLKKWVF